VFVLTSVKQQLRQFEDDLETINENLPADWDPVSGLTLVGKADVCPYNREKAAGFDDGNVYDRCETLRDRTRDLSPARAAIRPHRIWAARARSQQIGLADSGSQSKNTFLETAGEPTSYPPALPEYGDGGPVGAETEYCPFYAQYLEDLPDDEENGSAAEAVPVRLHRRRDGHPGGAGRPLGETRHLSHSVMGPPSARSRSSLATTTTRSTPNRRLLYRRVTRRVDVRRLRRGPHAGTARPRSGQRGRRRQHAPGRRNRNSRRSSSRSSSSAKGGRPKVAPRPPTQTSFARNSTTATSLMRNSIEHSSSSGISARNSTAGLPPPRPEPPGLAV